jgi:hypothetical protein
MNFIERVENILATPKTEWLVIAAESTTVPDVYRGYIAILAASSIVAGFIKGSLIGYGFFITVRHSIPSGLTQAIISFVLSLAAVYVMALIIDALAPTFGGQKNLVQALKTTAYALTASWIASIGVIVPWIGLLIFFAGGIYSIYLLYLGLPATMKCPPEKAVDYTAVSVICAIVLGWIVAIGGADIGAKMAMGGTTFDQNTWLGKMETANKQLETAQRSGDTEAMANAMREMMSITLAGGDKVEEALAPEVLKPFLPETLAGLKRTNFSAERNGAMGVQVSEAQATYSDGAGRTLRLDISDIGGIKGLAKLADWARVVSEKETDYSYEKTYKRDGRLVHEQWDSQSKKGEFRVVFADRFSVKVSGKAGSIDELKAAVASINLAGLEALKNQNVKKN